MVVHESSEIEDGESIVRRNFAAIALPGYFLDTHRPSSSSRNPCCTYTSSSSLSMKSIVVLSSSQFLPSWFYQIVLKPRILVSELGSEDIVRALQADIKHLRTLKIDMHASSDQRHRAGGQAAIVLQEPRSKHSHHAKAVDAWR